MRHSFASIVFATTLFALSHEAHAYYPGYTPNYAAFSCYTCHNNTSGGSGCASPPCLNPFGSQFAANGHVWNATLAGLDADGDGFSNGRELLDRGGHWQQGDANPGNYYYATHPGYATSDMNECAIGTVAVTHGGATYYDYYSWCSSSPYASCGNVSGASPGFSCSCPSGYSPSGYPSGQYCSDINECVSNPSICGPGTCSNTTGSYSCACNTGYAFDGSTCVVTDACLANTDNCNDPNATCTPDPANPAGNWTCGCKDGYAGQWIQDPSCGGYWWCVYYWIWVCSDVNECAAATSPCDANATCANTVGSYTCTCNEDFVGDGHTCDLANACHHLMPCDPRATCENGAGGTYRCTCNAGFQGTGETCADVDDCGSNNGGCHEHEHCVNQYGAPHTCECDTGYSRPDPTAACSSACGDGSRIPVEQCDDGNTVDGDGCSASCRIEPGYACHEPRYGTSVCAFTCGDGLIDPPGEQCDDGTSNSDTTPDACRTTCKSASCGDGVVDVARGEACDQGAANSDTTPDACRARCTLAFCGDGVVDVARGETCDHGYGQPLADDYCNTTAGCARTVPKPTPDGGVDGGTMASSKGGCGCSVGPRGPSRFDVAVILVVLAVFARRRGRRFA